MIENPYRVMLTPPVSEPDFGKQALNANSKVIVKAKMAVLFLISQIVSPRQRIRFHPGAPEWTPHMSVSAKKGGHLKRLFLTLLDFTVGTTLG